MAWTLELNSELQIIDLIFKGNVTGPEAREATSKAIALHHEYGILRYLVDTIEMESAPPIKNIYNLPTEQYDSEGLSHQAHIALVEPRSEIEKEATQFYQSVCLHRGWIVQLFQSRDEAIKWLMSADLSNKQGTD